MATLSLDCGYGRDIRFDLSGVYHAHGRPSVDVSLGVNGLVINLQGLCTDQLDRLLHDLNVARRSFDDQADDDNQTQPTGDQAGELLLPGLNHCPHCQLNVEAALADGLRLCPVCLRAIGAPGAIRNE